MNKIEKLKISSYNYSIMNFDMILERLILGLLCFSLIFLALSNEIVLDIITISTLGVLFGIYLYNIKPEDWWDYW